MIDSPTRSLTWGVGRYRHDSEYFGHFCLTEDEFSREAECAAEHLAHWGVGKNDIILIVAGIAEAAQFAPLQRAARLLGGISVTAEPSAFDARRVSALLGQFQINTLIGLDAAVLGGLKVASQGLESLLRCSNLIVRPDAIGDLRSLGFAPACLYIAGPTLAIECPHRMGAHISKLAWTPQIIEGRIVLRPAFGRDTQLPVVTTELIGTVTEQRCACGSDNPRILIQTAEQSRIGVQPRQL
jgi:hypothetical protein